MAEVGCRPVVREDLAFLPTMLGEAAVWRPDKPTPTGDEVMADPRYAMYLAGWGRRGDFGLIAEQEGPLGAAWYRTYTDLDHGYGFVAENVPELSIAVIESRRHEGIGRRLLLELIDASVGQGYGALSLSVAENNPARRLYESAGFMPRQKHGHSWTMVRYLNRARGFSPVHAMRHSYRSDAALSCRLRRWPPEHLVASERSRGRRRGRLALIWMTVLGLQSPGGRCALRLHLAAHPRAVPGR